MNTSSPTMTALACPEWCIATDEEHTSLKDVAAVQTDRGDGRGPTPTLVRDHEGPTFGRFSTRGNEDILGGTIWLDAFDDDGEAYTAPELRKLAADALAAAEWLEARQ